MSAALRNKSVAIPKAWPFEEAAKVAHRLELSGKGQALFETGYGSSGLPHIGTFGEVARTSWVRHAFATHTGLPSRMVAFSDDMDGLRMVSGDAPNRVSRYHLPIGVRRAALRCGSMAARSTTRSSTYRRKCRRGTTRP